MKEQNFASGQSKIEIGTLLHHSNQSLDYDLLPPDIVLANPGLAAGRPYARSENSHGRRFARAVRPKQTKDFAGEDLKRQAIKRHDFWLRLFLAFPAPESRREASSAPRQSEVAK